MCFDQKNKIYLYLFAFLHRKKSLTHPYPSGKVVSAKDFYRNVIRESNGNLVTQTKLFSFLLIVFLAKFSLANSEKYGNNKGRSSSVNNK